MDYCNDTCVDAQDWDEFEQESFDVCYAECMFWLLGEE